MRQNLNNNAAQTKPDGFRKPARFRRAISWEKCDDATEIIHDGRDRAERNRRFIARVGEGT